jgi:bacterioferritin
MTTARNLRLTDSTCRTVRSDLKSHTPVATKKQSEKQTSGGTTAAAASITREQLIENLNEDLSREYQAIIAYIVYSQAIKGAQYMAIAKELEIHAKEELAHALTIAKQIDYLGGEMNVTPKPVKTSEKATDMLRFDLENEATTIRAYRERVRQCEVLGEFAMAEHIREILINEQDHLIELATALGEDPPDVSG